MKLPFRVVGRSLFIESADGSSKLRLHLNPFEEDLQVFSRNSEEVKHANKTRVIAIGPKERNKALAGGVSVGGDRETFP